MDVPPNQTIYISNVYDKLKKDEVKRLLYALFGRYGRIMDVVVVKSERLRGRAWVVFGDISSATTAVREAQETPFFGKPLRVAYARTKSDAAALLDGEPTGKKRRRAVRGAERGLGVGAAGVAGEGDEAAPSAPRPAAAVPPVDVGEPSPTIFLEGLPAATTAEMLQLLFGQFPGFKGVRTLPARPGIAFVDFADDRAAGVAIAGLQGFRVTPEVVLSLRYAK